MTRTAHGLVLGKFYPLHAGHSHLIRTALSQCARVTVQVLASHQESIPLDTRVAWVREDHPGAHVVGAMDDAVVDYASEAAWAEHMAVIEAHLDAPVDAVFTSDAYGAELARRLGARWVQVDPGRHEVPVSGTAVRANPAAHWHHLSAVVRRDLAARVVVTGAESTGSTTLARALGARLGVPWVPEYGRDYTLERPGGLEAPWYAQDFDHIASVQRVWEERALRTTPRPLVICDTDILATALWQERYLGGHATRLREQARDHTPALYLLTGDEIAWEDDGSRDGREIRHAMQERFREALADSGVPWVELRGSVDERVEQALVWIDREVRRHLTFSPPLG